MDTLKFHPSLKLSKQEAVERTRELLFGVLGRIMTDGILVWRDITIGNELDARPHNFYKDAEYEFIFLKQRPSEGLEPLKIIVNPLIDPRTGQPEENLSQHVLHREYDRSKVEGHILVEYDDSLSTTDAYLTISDILAPMDSRIPRSLEPSLVTMIDDANSRTLANGS